MPAAGTGLAVDVTAGTALILGLVDVAAPFSISGLTPSTLNHLYLLVGGTGTSNTTGTAPANSVKLGTATTDGSSVTSVDTSASSGRQEKAAATDTARLSEANTFTQTNTFSGGIIVSADSSFADGVDLALGTTTGTKIGTATTQKLAFYNATPVVQPPANEDIRTSLIGLGLIAGGVNPLNLNGGALAVGAASFSGLVSGGAAGSAFALKRFALTFPSDADYTLAVGERDAIVIDVQTGVLTTTRAIVVPGTASGFYILINRNGQSVTLKTSGGTGITVATLRTAIIYFPGGVNAFRLTPDTDYSV